MTGERGLRAIIERAAALTAPPPAYRSAPILVGAAIAGVLSWPVESLMPAAGLDPSWEAALHLAQRNGQDFGTDLVFTYGPLGFLTVPRLFFTPQTLAALGFIAAAHYALAALIVGSLARVVHVAVAVVLTYALLPTVAHVDPTAGVVVAAFIGCVAVLRPQASHRVVTIFVPVIGLAAALVLLMKFNDGVILVGISSVTVLALAVTRSRFTLLPLYAATFAVAFAAAWLATGQSVDAIGPFVGGSLEVASGYSAAMGYEGPGREWEYGAAALLAAGVVVVARQGTDALRRPARLAVACATALVLFAAFKHGFVRHDVHAIGYFVVCALVVPAFVLRRSQWRPAVATAAGALLAVSLASGNPITRPFDVAGSATRFVEQVGIMVNPTARSRAFAQGVESVQRQVGLPPEVLDQVRGHRVHIDPWEASIAWAHYGEFEWRPVPVFQAFIAYTDELDDLNAAFLSSPDGPDRVLRQTLRSIDGRNPHWESPAYTLALLCHFREAWVGPAWQVLARTPNRCGEARLIQEVVVDANTPVPVPDAGRGNILVAAIHGLERPSDRIGAVLYKSGPVGINVDGNRDYRIIPGTAENGLILQVQSNADHSNGFAYPPVEHQLTVYYLWPEPTGDAPEVSITIDFLAIPIEPGASP
jgi:hypothetical protein